MFTHFDEKGDAIMVDIAHKEQTVRTATAVGSIVLSLAAYNAVKNGTIKKGDVLGIARTAGIMATKQTPHLIPLCHNIAIEKVTFSFNYIDKKQTIQACCTVKTTGKTGVEMEALTGVNMALLTIYDMCKAYDKSMKISDIYIEEKIGGKSGVYHHVEGMKKKED